MATKSQVAEIVIGGKLPAMLLQEFLAELNSTGARVGVHDGVDVAFQTADDLRNAVDDNGHLLLVAGKFEGLERFCVTHGISFDRHSDAGNICFRPGMKQPVPDTGSDALLDAGNIRPLAKEVSRLVTVTLTRQKLLVAVTKVVRHLNSLLPPELPPLEIGE